MKKTLIIIGICAGPHGYHPQVRLYDFDTISVNCNIFNTLVEFDSLFRIIPALAESLYNLNNLTWRFNLRKNVKFHNSYNFTVDDIKYTIDMIKADNRSVLRELLTSGSSIVVINEYTVDFLTEKPYPILVWDIIQIRLNLDEYKHFFNHIFLLKICKLDIQSI